MSLESGLEKAKSLSRQIRAAHLDQDTGLLNRTVLAAWSAQAEGVVATLERESPDKPEGQPSPVGDRLADPSGSGPELGSEGQRDD